MERFRLGELCFRTIHLQAWGIWDCLFCFVGPLKPFEQIFYKLNSNFKGLVIISLRKKAHIVTIKAYRRERLIFILSIGGVPIHSSDHRQRSMPPLLDVRLDAAAVGLLLILTEATSAVFLQKGISCPVFSMLLCCFLRNGMAPGNKLSVVRNGPRSLASAPLPGLDQNRF